MWHAAELLVVATGGGVVGAGELLARYRDAPKSALTSIPGITYVAVNALASVGALLLIWAFGWKFHATGHAVAAVQILVAAFGSMALFRTSLFTLRAGNEDIGVGPSVVLSTILSSCDRGVDRFRASDRADSVSAQMKDVSFAAAEGALPAVALALMQNLDAADQAALGIELERLRQDETTSDRAKSLLLGLAITNAVGPGVLGKAKAVLGDEILRKEDAKRP